MAPLQKFDTDPQTLVQNGGPWLIIVCACITVTSVLMVLLICTCLKASRKKKSEAATKTPASTKKMESDKGSKSSKSSITVKETEHAEAVLIPNEKRAGRKPTSHNIPLAPPGHTTPPQFTPDDPTIKIQLVQ